MGLIRLLGRKIDTAYWRARYWWFDTESGTTAQISTSVLAALVAVAEVARMAVAARPSAPQKAVVWWVVQLIIVVIASLVAYALRPKIQEQKQPGANPPSTEDGQAVVDILGTGWVDDYFVLGWKPSGVEKIKAKGKK